MTENKQNGKHPLNEVIQEVEECYNRVTQYIDGESPGDDYFNSIGCQYGVSQSRKDGHHWELAHPCVSEVLQTYDHINTLAQDCFQDCLQDISISVKNLNKSVMKDVGSQRTLQENATQYILEKERILANFKDDNDDNDYQLPDSGENTFSLPQDIKDHETAFDETKDDEIGWGDDEIGWGDDNQNTSQEVSSPENEKKLEKLSPVTGNSKVEKTINQSIPANPPKSTIRFVTLGRQELKPNPIRVQLDRIKQNRIHQAEDSFKTKVVDQKSIVSIHTDFKQELREQKEIAAAAPAPTMIMKDGIWLSHSTDPSKQIFRYSTIPTKNTASPQFNATNTIDSHPSQLLYLPTIQSDQKEHTKTLDKAQQNQFDLDFCVDEDYALTLNKNQLHHAKYFGSFGMDNHHFFEYRTKRDEKSRMNFRKLLLKRTIHDMAS